MTTNGVGAGAPVDGFGVGTHMGVSADAPLLDSAYKLVAFRDEPRMKLASRKVTLPGEKQIYRRIAPDGTYGEDTIATASEPAPGGQPLLQPVMRDGCRIPGSTPDLPAIREHARAEKERLPPELRRVDPSEPYPVSISPPLQEVTQRLREQLSS